MKVYINDKEFIANDGETIIELADRNDIHIPRFCYHKHLSVVASCRMCLVDIDKVNKAQPACSTPVSEGMSIHTKSQKTKDAQKSTMEFLLINHPLDCPICDQAGECELQDVSLQHGDSKSQYMQFKRVVIDEDISPLISTEMTRCIHCSRCVRFGEEIANKKELGLLHRGEGMEIRSAISAGVNSELSGNMIDLCPVGALNNKPYSYKARTWDLKQHIGVSPHDCIGSNIFYHSYNNKIVRAIPRDNPDINQTWISDRDRFGFEGIYADDRSDNILIRENNKLIDLDENLLTKSLNDCITNHIKINSEDDIGCFISAQSTSEEMLMFQRYLRNLGIKNLDHRTNEVDFNYQDNFPIMPHLGCQINELSKYDNIILFGVNIKDEYPILSIKLNEAVNSGTKIYSYHFSPIEELFSMEKLVCQSPTEIISELYNGLKNIKETKKTLLLIGPSINYLSNQTSFHSAVNFYSNKINADTGYLTDFCNSTSGWLLGNVPHRLLGGEKLSNSSRGLDTDQMIKNKLGMLIFYNLEPEYDFANSSKVISALQKSQVNIFFTSYITPIIEKYADFIIPISTFAETDGSFINIEGKFQSYNKIVNPTNKVQEGWKFLNELCILNDLEPYDISQVRHKIREVVSKIIKKSSVANGRNKNKDSTHKINKYMLRHIYSTDQIVRRSSPLHLTKQSKNKKIFVSSDIVQSTEDTKSITVDEKGKKYRINNFEINKDLPAGSIIYTSCFNNKFVEGKSSDIKIDK